MFVFETNSIFPIIGVCAVLSQYSFVESFKDTLAELLSSPDWFCFPNQY